MDMNPVIALIIGLAYGWMGSLLWQRHRNEKARIDAWWYERREPPGVRPAPPPRPAKVPHA